MDNGAARDIINKKGQLSILVFVERSMKKGFRVFLWVGSILCTLLAIAFFTAGFLPGLLMLLCALLVNPLILERINRKNGASTALLIAGLLIASIAALPGADGKTRGLETQADAGSVTRSVAADASLMSSTAQARNDEVQEETSASVAGIVAALPDENDDASREKQNQDPVEDTKRPAGTPAPTTQPLAKAAVKSTGIEIVSCPDTVSRGEYASVQIKGEPNTDYTCSVQYKTTMSTAAGLGKKQSDDEGYVTWKWKIGTRTSLDYRPTIYIEGGGDSASVRFQVVE